MDEIVPEKPRNDMDLSADARLTAGILLVTILAVEFGGTYMLRVVRCAVAVTPFQVAFARAGHAHAGVLVILGLVVQPFADVAGLTGAVGWAARSAIPVAAILMSAGFFLSSMGAGRTSPSRLILLVYAGAVSLALGALSLGIGVLAV
jgi:hypothetical protein